MTFDQNPRQNPTTPNKQPLVSRSPLPIRTPEQQAEFIAYRTTVNAGYAAIAGITADETLSQTEQTQLIKLDPSVKEAQQAVADAFASEEAELLATRARLEGEK